MNTKCDEIFRKKNNPSEKLGIKSFNSKLFREIEEVYKPINLKFNRRSSSALPRKLDSLFPSTNMKSIKTMQKINSFTSLLISSIIISGSIAETNLLFQRHYNLDSDINLIRIVLLCLALVQEVSIFLYYYYNLRMRIAYKIVSKHTNLLQDRSTLTRLVFESVISLIVIPPYVSFHLTISQLGATQTLSLDDILLGLVFLKVFHLLKFLYEFSLLNSLKAKFYSRLNNIPNGFKLYLKSLLKRWPYSSIVAVVFLCTLIFGILFCFYEQSVEGSQFSYFANGFWLVAYTQSTIGYGDILPKTHLGRLVIALITLIGLFLYSYLNVIIKITTTLTKKEHKLFNEIKFKSVASTKLEKYSVLLIQIWWRVMLSRKYNRNAFPIISKFYRRLHEFTYKKLWFLQEKPQTMPQLIENLNAVAVVKFGKLIASLEKIKFPKRNSVILSNKCNQSAVKLKRLANRLRKKVINPQVNYLSQNDGLDNLFIKRIPSKASMKQKKNNALKNMMIHRYSNSQLLRPDSVIRVSFFSVQAESVN